MKTLPKTVSAAVAAVAISNTTTVNEQRPKKRKTQGVRKKSLSNDVTAIIKSADKTGQRDIQGSDGVVARHCPFADAVNRIVLAAEGRQVHTSDTRAHIFGDSDEGSTSDDAETSKRLTPCQRKVRRLNDGPLTDQEISQLRVLCSSVTLNCDGSIGSTAKKAAFSWGNVGLDQLESLITMLEVHVNSASNIDIITSAFKILTGNLDENEDDGESFEGKKKLSIEQWLNAKVNVESSTDDASPSVGAGHRLLTTVRRGIESASIILSIMASCNDSSNNSRRCISEDTLEACLALLKQHLIKNIIPSLSETIPVPITAQDIAKPEFSTNKRKRKKTEKDSLAGNEGLPVNHGRDQKQSKDKFKTNMRKVYRPILSTHGLLTLLMERCDALIQSMVQLDDRPLLAITSSVLSIFTVDPPAVSSSDNITSIAHGVQVAAIRLITSVVRRYPRHRVIVMEDLFPLMLKLPTSKRSIRTYPLRVAKYSSSSSSRYRRNNSLDSNTAMSPVPGHMTHTGCIQVTTALILSIIQCFAVMPQPENVDEGAAKPSSRSAKKSKELRSATKYTSGLVDCNSACSFLATQLALRCTKKGQDGGASEFRPYMANLIDDLLLVQLFPEYPAAETLLMAFCRKLSSDLLSCKQEGAPAFEVTYMAIAMETLGKICAATAGHLRYNRENPLVLPQVDGSTKDTTTSINSGPINNEKEVNRCFCERINLVDTYMLDCDRCHGWFHASCVGIARDEVPSYWVCDECKIQIMIIEQIEVISAACSRPGNRASVLDELHVFRQLLLNHVTSLATVIPDAMFAREFLLAKWIDQIQSEKEQQARRDVQNSNELNSDVVCSYFLNQWISSIPCQAPAGETHRTSVVEKQQLSEEGNARVVRSLVAKSSELASSFPNQLGVIVKLMGDESANALRKLAVKAIAQVVQVDPSLMLQISLRQAVARRFQDEAISVREAAVTLVGCYVLQDPKVASAFHSSLITRLGDVGVSVRRRVVRIFRDLLISQPGYSGRVDVCRSMLQRAANPREEEGVRHDIKTMFKELWFDEEILRKSNSSMHGASDDLCVHDVSHNSTEISKDNMCKEEASGKVSKVPTIFPRRKNDVEARIKDQRFTDIVTQMVDVIAVSTDTGFLENMVKELFLVCEDHEDSKMIKCSEKKAIADYYCSNLVAALFEELLQFEEQRCRNARRDGDSRLVSIMVTIGIFCEAVPGLLAPHIDTLLPYLKADNLLSLDDEAKILIIICRLIVKLVSSVLPLADVQRLVNGSVSDDLEKITHKFGSVASAAAVEALAVIASRTGSSGDQRAENNLMKLAATFYGYLYKVKDMTSDYSTTTKGVQSNLKRALSVLQAVCQYYASNQHSLLADPDLGTDADPLSFPYLQPSLLSFSNLLDACFAAFSFYLGKEDIPTKCAALNAMSGVFLARPRTMLIVEKNGIFADLFSESMPPLVQLESLRCWKNILSAEEWRVESGRARERMDQNADVTLSKRISGDQDGDSSIAGSVLTQHTKRIYQLAKSPYAAIRLAAVDLVGLLLRQGLINPLETVPHLLALQGDVKSPTVRLLALQLLVREGEKRPDMLRQRVCAGVKEAYLFQREIIPRDEYVTAVTFEADGNSGAPKVECIFGLLYKECLSSSKAAKQALFRSLIKIFISFDFDEEESNVNDCSVEDAQAGAAKANNHKSTPNNGLTYARETSIDLPFLCYVSQILAHLPYNASMDPLFIIYHVSNAITVHGEPLLYRIARFLAPHYAVVGKAEDREDEDVDVLEEAAKSKAPCRTKAARVFESPDFDLEVFAKLCTKAASIVLLIRLQQFLKKVYSLSETRCTEYAPNEKERISDRSINTPEEMPVFNNKFEPCIQDSLANSFQTSSATKKDALIHIYAEFRYLMRKVGSTSLDEKSAESKSIKHTGHSELNASKCNGSSQELTSPSSVTENIADDNIGNDDEDDNMKSSKKRRKSSRTPPSKAPSKRKQAK